MSGECCNAILQGFLNEGIETRVLKVKSYAPNRGRSRILHPEGGAQGM
jgi:hypothetical protein